MLRSEAICSTKQFGATRQKNIQSSFQQLIPKSKLKEMQLQAPIQRERLKQVQQEQLVSEQIITPRARAGRSAFDFGGRFFFIPPFKLPKGGGGRGKTALTSTRKFILTPTFAKAKLKEEFGIGKIKPVNLGSLLDIVGTPGQIAMEIKRRKRK